MAALVERRHLDFVLDDVLGLSELLALPKFSAHDRAGVAQILDTAEQVAEECFRPSLRLVDDNEPRLENGRVVLPREIWAALEVFRDQGFLGMAARAEDGGLGLPRLAANAAFLNFQAANVSIANYALLTMSAVELLSVHATPDQKARYLTPMIEGRFFGTMALSEPAAGSSLGDITTSARRRADGSYSLHGTKMWISGGEHDMGENIVHLMLARIDGAERGVKGLSLFIVPRRRLDESGKPGVWNNIALAGLNHKLGQRGTVNTVLSIGDGGETIGEIVGQPGEGLACMFTMMNEARIGVSMGAVAHASAGFLHSLDYARERVQGRMPDQKDPATPQVALVQHADVRRMLLQQKIAAEGGIALALYLAKLADLKLAAATASERRDAALLLDLLTPVFKAWISEECLTANYNAIQVLGGAGYTRDHPVELHYRDNRLNPIHEGTNGIQAIDLVGRKLALDGGRPLKAMTTRIRALADGAKGTRADVVASAASAAADALETASAELAEIKRTAGVAEQIAHAADMMEIAGCTAMLWMWAEMATAGERRLVSTVPRDDAFLLGKLAVADAAVSFYQPRLRVARTRILQGRPPHLDIADAMLG